MTTPTARATCFVCRRPAPRCVCDKVEPVDNRTSITILQHPGERRHAFNSARLVKLALKDVSVHVTWVDDDGLMRKPVSCPVGTALLYPRDDARDLASLPLAEAPSHLIVLDGTWPQARRLYRDNPWMHKLPHVSLSPAEPSRYRIRQEPAFHCLSTIESIHLALQLLEPKTPGLDQMLNGFLAMVDTQADQQHEERPRFRQRSKPTQLDELVACWDRLVVCYGELAGLRKRGRVPMLVQWTAVRAATGELFSAQLPMGEIDPSYFLKIGGASMDCETMDSFHRRWASFMGTDAVLATWGPDQLPPEVKILPSTRHLSLRSIYSNYNNGLGGTLGQILAQRQVVSAPFATLGRTGPRLANAYAMAKFLCLRRLDDIRRYGDQVDQDSLT